MQQLSTRCHSKATVGALQACCKNRTGGEGQDTRSQKALCGRETGRAPCIPPPSEADKPNGEGELGATSWGFSPHGSQGLQQVLQMGIKLPELTNNLPAFMALCTGVLTFTC